MFVDKFSDSRVNYFGNSRRFTVSKATGGTGSKRLNFQFIRLAQFFYMLSYRFWIKGSAIF